MEVIGRLNDDDKAEKSDFFNFLQKVLLLPYRRKSEDVRHETSKHNTYFFMD